MSQVVVPEENMDIFKHQKASEYTVEHLIVDLPLIPGCEPYTLLISEHGNICQAYQITVVLNRSMSKLLAARSLLGHIYRL
jgi:hypothetical protein